jgi:hypothetical protein
MSGASLPRHADLLIKGYTQGRLRQMIFGGATHVLEHANLPVLLAH